jgi:hypothetical protein
MKTFEMFLEEAPQRLKMKRLYHGTDKNSSDSIDKGGYDTSKGENKLAGDGIYASKKRKIASDYANTRSSARGSTPRTKEFLVPKNNLGTKKARLRGGKPVPSKSDKIQKVDLNNYLLKDKDANRFSVSRQPIIRSKK